MRASQLLHSRAAGQPAPKLAARSAELRQPKGPSSAFIARPAAASSSAQPRRSHAACATSADADEALLGEFEEAGDFSDAEEGLSDLSDSDGEGPAIDTAGTSWGESALQVTRSVLQREDMRDLELFSFRAVQGRQLCDIRLDKLSDRYGSPMLDEIEAFSRAMYGELEALLGEEAAGAISFEVSSPGAERAVRVPQDLERFRELPMTVTYRRPGSDACESRVLRLAALRPEEGACEWQLANVRANRTGGKGARLTNKQAAWRVLTQFSELEKVRLYIEI